FPENNLVRRENRSAQTPLQRLDSSDGTETIPSDEDSFCLVRDIPFHPFIHFRRGNLCEWPLRCNPRTKHDFKPLILEIVFSLGIGFFAEPRWVNQHNPVRADDAKCLRSSDTGENHRNAFCSLLESCPKCALCFGTECIAAAGKSVGNRPRFQTHKLFCSVVDLWSLSKLPWVVVPLPRHP